MRPPHWSVKHSPTSPAAENREAPQTVRRRRKTVRRLCKAVGSLWLAVRGVRRTVRRLLQRGDSSAPLDLDEALPCQAPPRRRGGKSATGGFAVPDVHRPSDLT